jgi:hypothetical protein
MEIRFSEWQAVYLQALMEPLDSPDTPKLVETAEMSAANRLRELPESDGDERYAIDLALRSLSYVASQTAGKSVR